MDKNTLINKLADKVDRLINPKILPVNEFGDYLQNSDLASTEPKRMHKSSKYNSEYYLMRQDDDMAIK